MSKQEKNLSLKFQSIGAALVSTVGLPDILKRAGEKLASVKDDDIRRRAVWSAILGEDVATVNYGKTVLTRIEKRFNLTEAQAESLTKASALKGGGKVAAVDADEFAGLLEDI